MPGAEKLKSVCFKCKVNKWVVDYKEGNYLKISSTSVCLSCEQASLIEAQKKEIDRLKTKEQEQDEKIRKLEEHASKMEQLFLRLGEQKQIESEAAHTDEPSSDLDVEVVDRKVEKLRTIVMENRDEIVEAGRQMVEIREEIASYKDSTNFRVVRGKKSPKVNESQQGIALTNRFAALEDEVDGTEVEAFLIGDSIVRDQNRHFALKNKRRKVHSYPGCKAKKVIDAVNKLEVQSRNTCIIAGAGSNDLYLKGNKVGNTEPLVKDLKTLVDSVADRTDKGILIGIMPRLCASYYAMSKAIGINERMNKYCNEKKVNFIDVWQIFVGKWQYFGKDGIHLNEAGHRKLGEMLGREYNRMENQVNLSQRTPEPLPVQVARELENNAFEGFSKEN